MPHTDRDVPPPEPIPDPVARFTFTPPEPTTTDTVMFDASTSTPEGHIVGYAWRMLTLPIEGEGVTFETMLPALGVQVMRLDVRLADGRTHYVQQMITVVNPPPPDVEEPEPPPDE